MLLTMSASSAATVSAPRVASHANLTVKKTAVMQKVRVTKLVSSTPDKEGRVRVQLANGAVVPIPQADEKKVMSRAAQEAAQPAGVVSGNCGSSYITLSEKANGYPVAMQTGFTVVEPAIDYSWNADINGPGNYFYGYEAGGALALDSSWEGTYDSPANEPEGIYSALVSPDLSEATLWDGTVCTSGGPTDEEYLIAQAECLNNVPADAVFTGTGWIENTTTAVANINITTLPNGPGTRPATATACLTNPLIQGTDAGGNITGWADAQLFATDNGYDPTTALARCHLIGNAMGGRGIQANLVPCWQVGTNTGTPSMSTYEALVRAAVGALPANEAVYYQVTPEYYDSTSTIPYEISLTAEVQFADGTSSPVATAVIDNAPTGNPVLNLGN
jgi:hypothetical protein